MRTAAIVFLFLIVIGIIVTLGVTGALDFARTGFDTVAGHLEGL